MEKLSGTIFNKRIKQEKLAIRDDINDFIKKGDFDEKTKK